MPGVVNIVVIHIRWAVWWGSRGCGATWWWEAGMVGLLEVLGGWQEDMEDYYYYGWVVLAALADSHCGGRGEVQWWE